MKRIKIFDTTLRDGEQSPGCSMNLNEKIEMARQLEKLGVDVIEAGFAIASPMDFKSVQTIASVVENATVASLARCTKGDIDAAWDAVKEARHPRIHVFLATSDIHMEYKLRMTREQVLDSLDFVIKMLGTFDITTIRASMGMYLLCKWIHENTDIRVLLTGEISDELFGYKYTDFAPSAEEFQKESEKRIRELHMYDVLRADRCISVNSLEARVPFGDLDFVRYVLAIDPAKKMNVYGKGKYLLRHAFEGDYLPHDILYREKAAFSDAVGHSMVDHLKAFAEDCYTDEQFEARRTRFAHAQPFTKESLLYREIFEKYYPGQSEMIVDFWMPNKAWEGCDVNDPSARVLSNYGASGE